MTMTREQVAALLAQYERYTTGKDGMTLSEETTGDLARLCLSLMDQLADAQAAQAALVERAASVLDKHDCAPLVPHPNWPDAEQEGYRNAQLDVAGSWKSAIRALAPDAGVQALAALRAELEVATNRREMVLGVAERAQERNEKLFTNLAAAEDDNSRLAAELAEARKQVEALRAITTHGADTIATVLILDIAAALKDRDRVYLTRDETSLGPRILEFAAALAAAEGVKG